MYTTEKIQKYLIIIVIFLFILIPIVMAVSWNLLGWPAFPKKWDMNAIYYQERISLLKFMISLGLSVVGATWLLASGGAGGTPLKGKSRQLLSWS